MNYLEQQARFDEWITAHAGILHRIARGFAAPDDFNDLFQELLLALWKAIPSYRNEAQPSTFIYKVCHNSALSWKRSQRNYDRKVERLESLRPEASDAGEGAAPELLERLYAEIRKLPLVDRSLILLSLDGVSYREMAALHGISESNVGVRLTRLKEKLAANMKGVSYELR